MSISHIATRHRTTRQRQVILRQLQAVKSHPTADELCAMVRKVLPRVSLGTVYRNLELLHSQGLVLKLTGGPQLRFDATTGTHHHIRCLDCGKVADVQTDFRFDPSQVRCRPDDFELLGCSVEFVGRCGRCGKAEVRSKKQEVGITATAKKRRRSGSSRC